MADQPLREEITRPFECPRHGNYAPANFCCACVTEPLEVENERLRAFAFGDAPEWEKANATLKHRVRELEAQVAAKLEAKDTCKRCGDTGCDRVSADQPLQEAAWAIARRAEAVTHAVLAEAEAEGLPMARGGAYRLAYVALATDQRFDDERARVTELEENDGA